MFLDFLEYFIGILGSLILIDISYSHLPVHAFFRDYIQTHVRIYVISLYL